MSAVSVSARVRAPAVFTAAVLSPFISLSRCPLIPRAPAKFSSSHALLSLACHAYCHSGLAGSLADGMSSASARRRSAPASGGGRTAGHAADGPVGAFSLFTVVRVGHKQRAAALKRRKVVPNVDFGFFFIDIALETSFMQSQTRVAEQVFGSYNAVVKEHLVNAAAVVLSDLLFDCEDAAVEPHFD